MEWLGGLSNIKSHIGNITKELLSEGDTEVEDAKTQLDLSSSRIAHLQSIIDSQQLENSVLRNKNDELETQLESSLMRLDDLRRQFEQQQCKNEALVLKLRTEASTERGEPEGQSSSARSNVAELASEEYSYVSEAVCSGNADWEALCNEVSQLRAEVLRWRQLAKKVKFDETSHAEPIVIAGLEREVEDLRQQLACLDDTRRAEVAAERERQMRHIDKLNEQLLASNAEVALLRDQLEQRNIQTDTRLPLILESLAVYTEDVFNGEKCSEDSDRKTGHGLESRGIELSTGCFKGVSSVSGHSETEEEGLSTLTHLDVCTQTEDPALPMKYHTSSLKAELQEPHPLLLSSSLPGVLEARDAGRLTEARFLTVDAPSCFRSSEMLFTTTATQTCSVSSSAQADPPSLLNESYIDASDSCDLPSQLHYLEDMLLQITKDVHVYSDKLVEIFSDLLSDTSQPIVVSSDSLAITYRSLPNLSKPFALSHNTSDVWRKINGIRAQLNRQCERIAAACTEHSWKTPIGLLKKQIIELEQRLSESERISRTHAENLESTRETDIRLRNCLSSAVTRIMSRPQCHWLPPLTSIIHPWPPADPESQLHFLLSTESLSYNELQKISGKVEDGSEDSGVPSMNGRSRIVQVTASGGRAENIPGFSASGMTNLAYQLCMALDEDFCLENWDPEEWDAVLFALLKPRFSDPSELDGTSGQEVARLSTEVTVLQDALNQHIAFRAQAEHDLRQLLSTMTIQQEQLQSVMLENKKLHEQVATNEKSADTDHSIGEEPYLTETHPSPKFVQSKEARLEYICRQCDDLEQIITSAYHDVIHPNEANCNSSDTKDTVSMLKCLLATSLEIKSRAEKLEVMYTSLATALQEKHLESQTYHAQLQRACAEIQSFKEANQLLQEDVARLQQQLDGCQPISGGLSCSASSVDSSKPPVDCLTTAALSVSPNANEIKLLAEVSRLQSHLIEMEESYTVEALNAEAREVALRDRLKEVELRLHQGQHVVQTAEDRIVKAEKERDVARSEMEASEQKVIALTSNLANLQSVLESFQRNQQAAIAAEMKHVRSELQRACQREASALREIERLSQCAAERDKLVEEMDRMNEQVQQQSLRLACIQQQIEQKDDQIGTLRSRLAQMAVDVDSKIDKILMKNLILSYLQLPPNHRQKGIHIIGSLLHFTEEDYTKLNSVSNSFPRVFGWVQNAISRLPSGPPKDVTFSSTYPDKSFTELLLAFLKEEAGERVPMRLPVDSYTPHVRPIATQQQK